MKKTRNIFIGILLGIAILVVITLVTATSSTSPSGDSGGVGSPRTTDQSFWERIPFVNNTQEESLDDVPNTNTGEQISPTPIVYKSINETISSAAHLDGEVIRDRDKISTLSIVFMEEDNYAGFYNPKSDTILISITESPFGVNRLEAEQAFLQITGLSPDEACTIDVSLTTPDFVNPGQAGVIYRLSFCN